MRQVHRLHDSSIWLRRQAVGWLCTLLFLPSAALAATAAKPTFSPAAGSYTAPLTVTISDATPGARIYYTTNGTTPTTSSTLYGGPVTVSATQTIKAMAAASGYSNSSVASATYTTAAATPTFSPAAGSYVAPATVSLADATPGSSIYYTTNGTTPTTSSTRYTGPISVGATQTIKAIAAATGCNNSAVASATFSMSAASPSFSPAAGTYQGSVAVTLADSTPGAIIYFTTDGTTPTTASTQYVAPITVNATKTIKAMAAATGCSSSPVVSATYTVNLAPRPTCFSYDNAGNMTAIREDCP